MQIFDNNDFRYRLSDGYLLKVDRASMFNSVEVRNPLLDYRIAELLSKIPGKYKFQENTTKIVLRQIMKKKDLLTNEVFEQKKMGFSIPLRDWVHIELESKIKETILSSPIKSIIKENAMEYLFAEGKKLSMHNHFTETLWRLFVLAKFLNKWELELN